MGKGRDKRRRKAKNRDLQTRGATRAIAEPSSDPPIPGEPDAAVPAPLKPKPHLGAGSIAIPEPEPEDELVVVSPNTTVL